jgi:hypothetical protein
MRRIIMVVAVALVMAAMMLAMAMPVFAQEQGPPRTVPNQVCVSPADEASPVIRESRDEVNDPCLFNPEASPGQP